MKPYVVLLSSFIPFLFSHHSIADDVTLQQQIDTLGKRVAELEMRMDEINAADRWKEPALWNHLKKDMGAREVRTILGKPARMDNAIFTTWYYHSSSKLHSFVWFDEGKVLGWKPPDK